MKIALALDGNICSNHFGRCEKFKIYELSNNEIIQEKIIKNIKHQKNYWPRFLANEGVQVIIANSMGKNAQMLFKELNIEVITGIVGSDKEIINNYIKNKLKSDGLYCSKREFSKNKT